jgi:hypothetical protein
MLTRLLALATAVVAGLTIAPANAGAAAPSAPAGPFPSCAALRAGHALSADGVFTVAPSATIPYPMRVRCLQAGATWRLYLFLPNTGGDSNFAQYTAGGASPGTSVVTHYVAIQIDPFPVTLNPPTYRANIADQTFSTSSGQVCHSSGPPCPSGQVVTSMPYGVAMGCAGSGTVTGAANIDLRGTPFVLVNTYIHGGFDPAGTLSGTPQFIDVTGGGICGWYAPAAIFNPYNTSPAADAAGGWDLRFGLLL